ncbi:DUF6875 domain-containing protein [Streptomyces sp. NPDC085944]
MNGDSGRRAAGPGEIDELKKWIGDFLAEPHEDLGREGSVCP